MKKTNPPSPREQVIPLQQQPTGAEPKVSRSYVVRYSYMTIGFIMVGFALIGVFLPLMPTTIFLIIAAWFFARSSPRFQHWLFNHRLFGPMVRDWYENGIIRRKAKYLSVSGMALGFVVFYVLSHPPLWLAICVAVILLSCALYVCSRPETKKMPG